MQRPPMIPHTDQQLQDSAAMIDEPTKLAAKVLRINRFVRWVILPSRPKYLYGTGKIRKLRIKLYERLYSWVVNRVQGVDFPRDRATGVEVVVEGDTIKHKGTVFGKLDGQEIKLS